jgi:hypothetical protein
MQTTAISEAELLAALDQVSLVRLEEELADEIRPEEHRLLEAMDVEPTEAELAALDAARVERVAANALTRVRRVQGQLRLLADLDRQSLAALEEELADEISPEEQRLLEAMEVEPTEAELAALDAGRVRAIAEAALRRWRTPQALDATAVFSDGIALIDRMNTTQQNFSLQGREFEGISKQVTYVTVDLATIWRARATTVIAALHPDKLARVISGMQNQSRS